MLHWNGEGVVFVTWSMSSTLDTGEGNLDPSDTDEVCCLLTSSLLYIENSDSVFYGTSKVHQENFSSEIPTREESCVDGTTLSGLPHRCTSIRLLMDPSQGRLGSEVQ